MTSLKGEIKYIDLGVAIGALLDMASDCADLDECKEETIKMCIRELKKLPTIDPVSLRPKGEWIDYHFIKADCPKNGFPSVKCSACGIIFCDIINVHSYMYHFCPNCGADMRGNVDG